MLPPFEIYEAVLFFITVSAEVTFINRNGNHIGWKNHGRRQVMSINSEYDRAKEQKFRF